MSPQNHSIRFDAFGLSSGVYMYSLRVNDVLISTQKMVLMKQLLYSFLSHTELDPGFELAIYPYFTDSGSSSV